MKLIHSVSGTVSVHISSDDVVPERGLLQRDLVQHIGDMYNFAIRPNIPPNAPPQMFPVLTFQQGRFLKDGEIYPIQQLAVLSNGDAVTSMDTELSELIMDDYIKNLDDNYHYRYAGNPQVRYYASNIVIEFEKDVGEKIFGLQKVGDIINQEIRRDDMPFNIKNITFGYGDAVPIVLNSADVLKRADFTLERRGGESYERNRFFSTAPVPTYKHIQILKMIEQAIS